MLVGGDKVSKQLKEHVEVPLIRNIYYGNCGYRDVEYIRKIMYIYRKSVSHVLNTRFKFQ